MTPAAASVAVLAPVAPVAPVDPTAPVEPVAVVVEAAATTPSVIAPTGATTPGALGEQPAKVEVITKAEAERRNKSLKGYQYVPVVSKADDPLPAKRQRKKINYQEIAKANLALDGSPKKTSGKKSKKSKKKKKKATPKLGVAQTAAVQEYVPAGAPVVDPALGAAASQLSDLADRRKQLEMELAALTASLTSITEQLEHRQETLTKVSGQKRKSSEVTGAAAAPAPKKAAPKRKAASSAGRPKRDRKKKTPAIYQDDDEDEAVPLSPALRSCRRVLLETLQHNYAFVFAEPVDPVALNIPDYFTIITNPMDLGTIRKKLDAGEYDTVDQFKADVDLVFKNACTYNLPGSDVYVMSEIVQKEFNKKFAPVLRRQRAPSRKKREYTPPPDDDVEMVEAPPPRARSTRRAPKKKKKEALPMTKEEKRALSQAINHLPSDNLGMVVRIIQESLPHINDQAEEIEIDIDALDAVALRQLEDYVNEVKKKRTPKPKAQPKAASASSPKPKNKLDQAERTASGTQQKITDIEKQIESLNNESSALQTKPKKDEDVVIDDEDDAQATAYPPVVIDKDQSSDSESSDSESGTSSESGSDDDSDTDSESERVGKASAAVPGVPAVAPAAVAPAAAAAAAAPAPAPAAVAPAAEEADVPQILPSATTTAPKVVPVVNSEQWQKSLGSSVEDAPVTAEEKKAEAAPLWSEFKHKDSLQKQKEKEKQEREEQLRREMDEQEAKRRAEEERKSRELAEEEARKRAAEEEARKEQERKVEEQRLQEKKDREAKMRAMQEEEDDDDMDLDSFAGTMGHDGPPTDLLRGLESKEDGEL